MILALRKINDSHNDTSFEKINDSHNDTSFEKINDSHNDTSFEKETVWILPLLLLHLP